MLPSARETMQPAPLTRNVAVRNARLGSATCLIRRARPPATRVPRMTDAARDYARMVSVRSVHRTASRMVTYARRVSIAAREPAIERRTPRLEPARLPSRHLPIATVSRGPSAVTAADAAAVCAHRMGQLASRFANPQAAAVSLVSSVPRTKIVAEVTQAATCRAQDTEAATSLRAALSDAAAMSNRAVLKAISAISRSTPAVSLLHRTSAVMGSATLGCASSIRSVFRVATASALPVELRAISVRQPTIVATTRRASAILKGSCAATALAIVSMRAAPAPSMQTAVLARCACINKAPPRVLAERRSLPEVALAAQLALAALPIFPRPAMQVRSARLE